MAKVLFKLPLPSSALGGNDITFKYRSHHTWALELTWDDLDRVSHVILFEGIEVFKCTYMLALSREQIRLSYDELVEIPSSEWLQEVKGHFLAQNKDAAHLKHLMICLDDGPCYEFICSNYRIETPTHKESIIDNNL